MSRAARRRAKKGIFRCLQCNKLRKTNDSSICMSCDPSRQRKDGSTINIPVEHLLTFLPMQKRVNG